MLHAHWSMQLQRCQNNEPWGDIPFDLNVEFSILNRNRHNYCVDQPESSDGNRFQ
jgi:hypothetical protein